MAQTRDAAAAIAAKIRLAADTQAVAAGFSHHGAGNERHLPGGGIVGREDDVIGNPDEKGFHGRGQQTFSGPRAGSASRVSMGVAVVGGMMLATGLITLAMPAEVGPRFLGHFGFIHAFSFLTLFNVPAAYIAARRGHVRAHRANMIGLYVGGILIAGSFALAPGRLLHTWIFG